MPGLERHPGFSGPRRSHDLFRISKVNLNDPAAAYRFGTQVCAQDWTGATWFRNFPPRAKAAALRGCHNAQR